MYVWFELRVSNLQSKLNFFQSFTLHLYDVPLNDNLYPFFLLTHDMKSSFNSELRLNKKHNILHTTLFGIICILPLQMSQIKHLYTSTRVELRFNINHVRLLAHSKLKRRNNVRYQTNEDLLFGKTNEFRLQTIFFFIQIPLADQSHACSNVKQTDNKSEILHGVARVQLNVAVFSAYSDSEECDKFVEINHPMLH